MAKQGTYKVVKQEHETAFMPNGSTAGMFTVHLEHGNGTKTTIKVPDNQYTPENVHKVAQAQANAVQAVGDLPAGAEGAQ